MPGEIDDDMAVVVVRTSADDLASLERSSRPSRSGFRRPGGWRTRRSCAGAWIPSQAELACLLVSEVVTNVVLHAAVESSRGSGHRAR